MNSPLLEVDAVGKNYTSVRAVDDVSFRRPSRRDLRLPRAERRRQDDHHPHVDRAHPAGSRHDPLQLARRRDTPVQEQIGYLPEERGLYPKMPIMRTLVFLAGLRGMPAAAAAEAASVWLKRLGLGDRQHDKLNTLSKGNQQKVQFISAILHKPKFVILDEPFTDSIR
jgi:ABC-2 type transport system ATP-binding protein